MGACNNHVIGSSTFTTCISNDTDDVIVDMNVNSGTYNWEMMLERKTDTGGWKVIGTRSGYVSPTSPSSRTFTDVLRTGYNVMATNIIDETYVFFTPEIVR